MKAFTQLCPSTHPWDLVSYFQEYCFYAVTLVTRSDLEKPALETEPLIRPPLPPIQPQRAHLSTCSISTILKALFQKFVLINNNNMQHLIIG